MKCRSALLIACLIVVPLLAMVSHKVPAATRVAIRERLWDPMIAAIGLGSSTLPRPSQQQPSQLPPTTDPGVAVAAPLRAPPAALAVSGSATADSFPPSVVRDEPLEPSAVPFVSELGPAVAATAPPPVILRGADDSLPIGGGTGRESLEARLRALGATRIDWTPGQGGDGLHRCSCRIPAEPTGQLHRVFQAAAADPVAALDNLVGQVTAWSMRTGGTATGPSTPR